MKKVLSLLLLALCLLPGLACADDFTLEEEKTITGMLDRSWLQGYEPTIAGDTLTICLPISSTQTGGKIKATLIMDDEAVSPLRPQTTHAYFWPTNGLYSVSLSLKLHKPRTNGDYTGVVRIEETEAALVADFPITIRIRDGENPPNSQPIIALVSADLKIGEASAITATLTNTSRVAEMTGVQLIITDPSGEILPEHSDKLALGDLLPGESCEITYPVSVLPGAKVSLHTLEFKLSYTTVDQPSSWSETFTLPVTQEIRLEQGGLQLANTVIQGDMASLTLPLMNMGRGELSNVMATLSLPGITERQSVLVGVMAVGDSKSAKLTFTPGKDVLGEVSGQLTVTCEDAWGNQDSFSLPVSVVVEEPAAPTSTTPTANKEESMPWLLYALAGGGALLVILLIVQGTLLRRKIARLEESRL